MIPSRQLPLLTAELRRDCPLSLRACVLVLERFDAVDALDVEEGRRTFEDARDCPAHCRLRNQRRKDEAIVEEEFQILLAAHKAEPIGTIAAHRIFHRFDTVDNKPTHREYAQQSAGNEYATFDTRSIHLLWFFYSSSSITTSLL